MAVKRMAVVDSLTMGDLRSVYILERRGAVREDLYTHDT